MFGDIFLQMWPVGERGFHQDTGVKKPILLKVSRKLEKIVWNCQKYDWCHDKQ